MKQTLHYKALLLFLLVLVHSSKLSARFLLSKQGNLPPLPTLLEIVCCFQKLKFCMFCRERGFEPERNHQRRDFCANGGQWIDNECKLQPFSVLSGFRHKWTTAYISFFLVFFICFQQLMGLEVCRGGDEECFKRRIIAEAHLDYIYTQHHKPWHFKFINWIKCHGFPCPT